jgi:hypothetical protein
MILDQLYTGGYSAVADTSKFFYNFPTRIAERKYLGCIHPVNPNDHLVYGGLPMGAGNSLAIAGRHGAASFRKLKEICPLYRGKPVANTWWRLYSNGIECESHLGHGLVFIGDDGSPAGLVWAHRDDFLLHGPTYQKTVDGLTAFLDLTVRVGLLCHPGKLTPPTHVVKYRGLLFDTTSTPTTRLPEYNRAKAVAMIDFAKSHRQRISRLGLAVAVGVLESMVEGTPSRIGHTYLHNVQETLHPKDWEGYDFPYYSFAELSERDCSDLKMWEWILERNDGRQARGSRSGTLVPSFGDGSGTGTGGMVQYVEGAPFEMWMGTWHPRAYHFSANWKEMRTPLATLERAKAAERDVTFFYFTDSSTVYYAVSKGSSTSKSLHAMVEKIKRSEIELGCHLEVVHVPGTTIITERTDGLSRGIWISTLHPQPTQQQLLSEIFAPVTASPDIHGFWTIGADVVIVNIVYLGMQPRL